MFIPSLYYLWMDLHALLQRWRGSPCRKNSRKGEVIRQKGEHSVLLAARFLCYIAQIRTPSIHGQWCCKRFRIQRCDSHTWSICPGINFPLQELHCQLIVELWKYSMIHSDTAFVDQEGSPHIFHIVNGIQNLQREGITFPCKGYQKYFHYASMLAFLLDILSNSWKTLYALPYELHKSNIIFFQTLHIIAIWKPLADHSHKLQFF